MIHDFINDICDILGIDPPEMSNDTSHFLSDTMMAQCDPSGSTIYIRPCEKATPDQFFAIAHELRHVWQLKTNKERYISDYKPIDLCGSVEAYNLQKAEIDANAFAGLVMIDFFHIKPLFQGLPDSVKSKIFERMEELKRIYR